MEKVNKGRPIYQPTEQARQDVIRLASVGVPEVDIGRVLGISRITVRKYFSHELETGHIHANVAVANSLFRQATNPEKPNVTAAIFWLKCRAGWREDGEELGKKETAQLLSQIADKGTAWEGLLS